MIISETENMARKFIEFAGQNLKYNPQIRHDFGNLLDPRTQSNEKDSQEAFITKNGVMVEGAGMGKQLRGRRFLNSRPTLILADDIESSRNTNTPELREKNLHWWNSVVMPMGSNTADYIYMGTLVCVGSLLDTVLNRADFKSKVYSAIVEPPEHPDLWDKFETMLRDEQNDNRMEEALDFYETNKLLMEKVKVLWNDRMPYWKLMVEKTQMTSRSFASEYLNQPTDLESQLFRKDHMTFFDYPDLEKIKSKLDFYGAWDIAFGKSNRSDYNAVIIVGRDRTNGLLYIVETWAEKCPAHIAMQKAAELIMKWKPKTFAVETVQAQFDLFRQLQEYLNKKAFYTTRLKPVTTNRTHGKKEERVEQLEPLVQNGTLRFMRHQHLLIEQLELFPVGNHDDLPDCLSMTLDLCRFGAKRRAWGNKPKGL